MSTETQKVDVLAVMDKERPVLIQASKACQLLKQLTFEEALSFISRHDEARAAVAELIEASKEASGWVDQVSAAGCKAIDRLAAALARVGGDSCDR